MNLSDMQKFCDPTDVRLYCTRPISDGNGHILATDGRIIVSCAGDIAVEQMTVPESVLQTFATYLDPALFNDGFVPLQVGIPPYPRCVGCNGTGKVNKPTECPECDGEGEVPFGKHWYECKECDGDGKIIDHTLADVEQIDCEKCDGTGHAFHPVQLDGRKFQAKYLEKMLSLPGIEYAPSDDANAIMHFRFDGGIGCLMPVHDSWR